MTIMDKFSPEFAQHWLTDRSSTTDRGAADGKDESMSASQQEALDALAERVSAARSVF